MEATPSWRVTHAVYQVGGLELHPTRSDGGHSKLESDSRRVPGGLELHPTRSDGGHSKLESDSRRVPGRWTRVTSDSL
ncbi:hypothetical protein RRG08_067391 [Elysia crispata]|uniref:Uncharacterized protein n=1 Tax=Elysia crispata TaxID=231223 RepID=A0AAE0Y8Z6_9GAST|nr:hypothetical protein RRG08_067391 [Elysia crispata]